MPEKILAIETSCDETAAAVVEGGRHVLSSCIASQAEFHATYGGVIPEFAARQHLEGINLVVAEALHQAECELADMDAFAATLGPGLVGALLVGANTAKSLSLLTQKPFIGVNHLYAHVASNYLDSTLEPPFVCLLVSGGHTQLLDVSDYDTMAIIGETLDDAVGEAYDKVARLLGLPYPGGPVLDKLAQQGDPHRFELPTAKTKQPWDFSYSGLKTAMARLIEKESAGAPMIETLKADLAASFQHVATQVLVDKTMALAEQRQCKTIAVAGGVAANSALRQKCQQAVEARSGWQLFVPPMRYCTDNAAMVGASAFFNPVTTDMGMEVFSRSSG